MIETEFEEECCAPVFVAARGGQAAPDILAPPQPKPQLPAPAAERRVESRPRRVLVVELL